MQIPKKTLIVGCKGRMGSMLLQLASEHHLEVTGIDLPFEAEKVSAAAKGSTFVLFCIPVGNLEASLRLICPHLDVDCILSDITSVKEQPMQYMEAVWDGDVVGTHPLFGPKFEQAVHPRVAIIPGKASTRSVLMTEGFFQALGFTVFRCTAEEHDRAMASIQNLNFISNLAYFALLAQHKELIPYITPSFQKRLNAAQKMLTEDAAMFTALFEANSHSQEVVRKYSAMLNLAAAGDIELLNQRAQWWWPQSKE